MKAAYTPSSLITAAEHIRKAHPSMREIMQYVPDEAFLEEVKRWAKLPTADITGEAFSVPKRKIRLLAKYIPENTLNLPLQNLTQIVYLRADEDIVKLLFILWQDFYLNKDLCNLLHALVTDKGFASLKLLNQSAATKEMLLNWFSSSAIPQVVGRDSLTLQHTTKSPFPECLKAFHIMPSSRLGQCCITEFLTYCDRDDYLAIPDVEMLRSLKKLSLPGINLFLKNILSKLQVQEFQQYYMCGSFLREQYTGSAGSDKYKKFFTSFSSDLELKYRRWLNYILVKDSFARNTGDERLIFWSQYVPYSWNAYRVRNCEALVMEFAAYCIIEFTTATMGPIYIYQKSTFEDRIKWHLPRCSNTELRSLLYHDLSSYYTQRIEHRGDWKTTTRWYLMAHSITH